MARYVATQPIYYGNALAFAAGSQVPEEHVERFGYLDAGMVAQVADDHRGDAPDLVPAQPDNTPPPLPTHARFVDEATQRVEQAQREFAAAQADRAAAYADERARLDEAAADLKTADPGRAAAAKPGTAKAKPATGDTTTAPVKEA